jgi:hypothetical protein
MRKVRRAIGARGQEGIKGEDIQKLSLTLHTTQEKILCSVLQKLLFVHPARWQVAVLAEANLIIPSLLCGVHV